MDGSRGGLFSNREGDDSRDLAQLPREILEGGADLSGGKRGTEREREEGRWSMAVTLAEGGGCEEEGEEEGGEPNPGRHGRPRSDRIVAFG